MEEEFNCIICADLFYQPVTLPCGHSFCKTCIIKSINTKPVCPMCRTPVLIDPNNLQENLTLRSILEQSYKESYQQRKLQAQQALKKEINIEWQQQQIPQQQQQEHFKNKFVCFTNSKKCLFPGLKEKISIKMQCTQEQFGLICPDRNIICLPNNFKLPFLGVQAEIIQFIQSESNGYYVELQIIKRVMIENLKTINSEDNEEKKQSNQQQQPQQQQQQPQPNPQSQPEQGTQSNQQFKDQQQQNQNQLLKYNFTVAEGYNQKDENVAMNDNYLKNIKDQFQEIVEFFNKSLATLGNDLSFTKITVLKKLQENNLIQLLQQNLVQNIQNIEKLSLVLPGIFNYNDEEQQRLFHSTNLLERLILINQYSKKWENIQNPALIFSIDGQSKSLMSISYTVILIIGIILAILYLKFTKQQDHFYYY